MHTHMHTYAYTFTYIDWWALQVQIAPFKNAPGHIHHVFVNLP